MLRLNVAIVWPELANAGPTLLGYVALRCIASWKAGSSVAYCESCFLEKMTK